MPSNAGHVTLLIQQWQQGSREAGDELIERLYPELKKIARALLRHERLDHTFQPTALVNELYIKLVSSLAPIAAQNRPHFLALIAQSLRHILVDHARLHGAKKRGNGLRVTLDSEYVGHEAFDEDLIGLDEALTQLKALDSRAAQVVELKFFAGLSEQEIAQVLTVSRKTVERDWIAARAWLLSRISLVSRPRSIG